MVQISVKLATNLCCPFLSMPGITPCSCSTRNRRSSAVPRVQVSSRCGEMHDWASSKCCNLIFLESTGCMTNFRSPSNQAMWSEMEASLDPNSRLALTNLPQIWRFQPILGVGVEIFRHRS